MGSKLLDKKRKSAAEDSESDDELVDANFDGILSESDHEFDDVGSGDEADQNDDDESGSEGSQSGGDDGDEDDAFLSDDIPSDVDGEEAINRLLNGYQDLEIEEPGVDPKRKEEDNGDRNYRIDKDANGNDRYVYEYVAWCRIWLHGGCEADLWPGTVKSILSTTPTILMLRGQSTR